MKRTLEGDAVVVGGGVDSTEGEEVDGRDRDEEFLGANEEEGGSNENDSDNNDDDIDQGIDIINDNIIQTSQADISKMSVSALIMQKTIVSNQEKLNEISLNNDSN